MAIQVVTGLQKRGINAFYTRMGDTRPSETLNTDLYLRADYANRAKADFFISIHCNSNAGKPGTGTETYVYGLGGEAEKLARLVQSEVVQAAGTVNRGVKVDNFAVIRETKMPAILVEMGFINNPDDESKLLLRQHDFAQGIINGVLAYLGMAEKEEDIVESVTVKVKDTPLQGWLIEGKTYVPLRELVELLAYKVEWDATKREAAVT